MRAAKNPTVTDDRKAKSDKPIMFIAGDQSASNCVPGVPSNAVISEM